MALPSSIGAGGRSGNRPEWDADEGAPNKPMKPAFMRQYAVGHLTTVETIERRLAAIPGLLLAGGGYRGVGIADCVRSGEAAADAAFARR